MHTIGEEIKVVASLVPATRTSTTSSETVVDTYGFQNVCWVVSVGNLDLADLDETYVAAVYESANSDGSSASAISGATVSMTADNTIKKIQITGLGAGSRLRYQFIRFTLAGTSPSMPGEGIAILARASFGPTQAPDVSV